MKILINTPNINGLGGVSNHYFGLKNYWTENVYYNEIGNKRTRKWLTLFTIIKFIWLLIFFSPDIVLVNPSLGQNALKRDFFYMRIARLFGVKTVCFIHGFNLDYAKTANWKWITYNLNKANCVIVLAQSFKSILIDQGVKTRIELSTTKVLDTLVADFDISTRSGKIDNILFLSRIERAKGVYEALDTFEILKKDYPHLHLTYVGDGSELGALKTFVKNKNVPDVHFTGALNGNALIEKYKQADFFFFFTSYGEGMPTVVLEAMAFGLPVMTRTVGGLCDFFENGKMGVITDSMNPNDYAKAMHIYLKDPIITRNTSIYNYKYAKQHFMASKVASNLETIFRNL